MIIPNDTFAQDDEIDPEIIKLQNIINNLESQEYRNRYPGSEGNELTSVMLLERIQNSGLKPLNGVYKQDFKITIGLEMEGVNTVEISKLVERPGLPKERWGKATKEWTPGKQYMPVSISSNGTVSGEIAFVGYGITAPEINYDDYAGVDVKDKIVIILSDSVDGFTKRKEFQPYAWLSYKAKNAKEHGAKGVIFIKTLSDSSNTFYPLEAEERTEDIGIVAIQANRTAIAKYFPRHANLYPTEIELQKTQKPNSFNLENAMVTISVNLEVNEKTVSNIMGVVPGNDGSKSSEFIFVSSNFDNKRPKARSEEYKKKFPALFNDEKSTGFAGMIALIDRISKEPLSRPVVFVGFNAKVFDFAGAKYFTEYPPVPLKNIFTFINLDKLDKLKRDHVVILGENTSDVFPSLLEETAKEMEMKIEEPNWNVKGDYAMFYFENVPIVRISGGYALNLYERKHESDDVNYEGMVKLIDFTQKFMQKLDDLGTKPEYIPNSLFMGRVK